MKHYQRQLLLIFIFAFLSTTLIAQEKYCINMGTGRDLAIKKNGEWKGVFRGKRLKPGDRIKNTGSVEIPVRCEKQKMLYFLDPQVIVEVQGETLKPDSGVLRSLSTVNANKIQKKLNLRFRKKQSYTGVRIENKVEPMELPAPEE